MKLNTINTIPTACDATEISGLAVGHETVSETASGKRPQDQTRDFLAALFGAKPAELFILIWLLVDKTSRWFRSVAEAAAYVERFADQDVYIAVALSPADFGLRNRCKAADTGGIAGLWVDLDYQSEAHKKNNLPPTADAARELIPAELQPSIVLHSGHGLQAWWLFPTPWIFTTNADRDAAAILADSFKALFKMRAAAQGWDIDSVADLARVMRIPGTTNTKVQGDHRRVELVEINDRRYTPEQIREYLAGAGVVAVPHSRGGGATAPAARPPLSAGALLLDAQAEPPFEKFELLCGIEPKFRASWDRKRSDMKDGSPSAYDQSLANYAARIRWTDQEITNLLIAHRRKHGDDLKLRQDYYKRTIVAARASADPYLKEEEASEFLKGLQEDFGTSDPGKGDSADDHECAREDEDHKSAVAVVDAEARRAKILNALSIRFKVPLKHIFRLTGEDPRYRLETELGDVPLGNVNGLICQGKLRSSIAAATGLYLPHFEDKHWPEIARLLLQVCEERDRGQDATLTGKVTDWLRSYLGHKQPHETLAEADEGREPFLDGGSVYIFAGDLRRWLAAQQGERVTPNLLTADLRAYGAEPRIFELLVKGKLTTRSAWRIPAGLWEPDAPESQ